MKLQNLRMAGQKIAIGKDKVTLDANGTIDVKDPDVIASLVASGFLPIGERPKVKETDKPLIEKVAPPAPEMEMIAPEEQAREIVKEKENSQSSKWTRKS